MSQDQAAAGTIGTIIACIAASSSAASGVNTIAFAAAAIRPMRLHRAAT